MMIKTNNRAAIMLYVVIIFLLVSPILAGNDQSDAKVGLTASVQDNHMDILVPIWFNSHLVLTPVVGAAIVGDARKDYDLGLIARYNLKQGEAVPYLGLRFGALIGKPEGGDGTIDFILGPLFGGEYFLKERFSVGVEAQLNVAISDEKSYHFGNPDKTNFNTATAVFATFYF